MVCLHDQGEDDVVSNPLPDGVVLLISFGSIPVPWPRGLTIVE